MNECRLSLPRGITTLVDKTTWLWAVNITWYTYGNGTRASPYYAYTQIRKDGQRYSFRLHRLIMNAPDGVHVDHINNDTLDNRLSNLRLADDVLNGQNRNGANSNSTTGVRGVQWLPANKSYRAVVSVRRTTVYDKSFKTLEEAEKAVQEARRRLMPYSKEALR